MSYASEDEGFAKPLANALEGDFEVWFAPYKLTIGDSLLQMISKGLSECDYGVVILSPFFFAKNWPTNELDGLFSLETKKRKVILPVWKDVSQTEVSRYSPILGGRFSAQASRGVAAVVDEIKAAIAASNRMAQFSAEAALKALVRSLEGNEIHYNRAKALYQSGEGVSFAYSSAAELVGKVARQVDELQAGACRFQFTVKREIHSISVIAPYRTQLDVMFRARYSNLLEGASLSTVVYLPARGHYDEETTVFCQKTYFPGFGPNDEVIWIDEGKRFSTEMLSTEVVSMLLSEVANAHVREHSRR